jgi:Jacalin-like lectin domain
MGSDWVRFKIGSRSEGIDILIDKKLSKVLYFWILVKIMYLLMNYQYFSFLSFLIVDYSEKAHNSNYENLWLFYVWWEEWHYLEFSASTDNYDSFGNKIGSYFIFEDSDSGFTGFHGKASKVGIVALGVYVNS